MVENIGYPEYIMDNKLLDDQYKDVSFIIYSNCHHDFIICHKGKKSAILNAAVSIYLLAISDVLSLCPFLLSALTKSIRLKS